MLTIPGNTSCDHTHISHNQLRPESLTYYHYPPRPGLPGYRFGLGLVGNPDERCDPFPTEICSPRVAATALAPCKCVCPPEPSPLVTGYDTLISGAGLGGEPDPVCSDIVCGPLLISSWSVSESLSSGIGTSSPSLDSSGAKDDAARLAWLSMCVTALTHALVFVRQDLAYDLCLCCCTSCCSFC